MMKKFHMKISINGIERYKKLNNKGKKKIMK